MAWSLPTGNKFLLFIVAIILTLQNNATTAYGSGSSGTISMVQPNCADKCGNVSIPYPFGTGAGCFREEPFEVTCNRSGAYLARDEVQVLDINLTVGEVRVQNPRITRLCNYTNGRNSSAGLEGVQFGPLYRVSYTKNKFTAIGCAVIAIFVGSSTMEVKDQSVVPHAVNACFSYCTDANSVSNSTECSSGKGCCQASISGNISRFETLPTPLEDIYNSTIQPFRPCTYTFLVEEDWFKFDRAYVNSTNFANKYTDGVPLVLDWVVGNKTCTEARNMGSQYACQAMNSECVDVSNGPGYRCSCSEGYEGNPYLEGGCQDIDECKHPNQSLYPCNGNCRNTNGSYSCLCPSGFKSSDPKILACVRDKPDRALKMAIGMSVSIIFLMVCIFALWAMCQKKKLAKEKERFFDQNGGQILYHQIMSKQVDTVRIFTQEDLKKATNNFNKNRELGTGGHGTVYKGVLTNNRVVAVKRSKIINMTQTDEFVQEIIILSQINHRNVVRLLGCCLEVEVPILVYEFIPNGTLFEFIHRNYAGPPASLDTRLRIAQESAEALAYLHLSTNRPIVHGDVKSMNILLDDNYMVKVTDFGASRMLPKDAVQFMTMVQGTMGYLDPEYLQERQLTEKSDVYSFGVVLLELITGKTAIYYDGPKEGKSLSSSFLLAMKEDNLEGILDTTILGAGMDTLLEEVAELGRMCLSSRGEERPSMTQVADMLKALRSTWREKLVQDHGETKRLVECSSLVAPAAPCDSTGSHMLGIDIETPR